MIDIHSHIIPGVDDGASSLEEAIEMIMMAIDQDVNKIILTPHSN
ncbi:CpsB/CapC family capsule biosynthesis tyrosine phosphatase, partial [Faecalitalea cylindroides]